MAIFNLPSTGTFASGSGGGGTPASISNARLRAEYNSDQTTRNRRIQIRAEMRKAAKIKGDRAAAKAKVERNRKARERRANR